MCFLRAHTNPPLLQTNSGTKIEGTQTKVVSIRGTNMYFKSLQTDLGHLQTVPRTPAVIQSFVIEHSRWMSPH